MSCTASYNIKLEHQSRKSSYCRRLTRTGTGLERDIFAVPLQSRTEHIVSVFSLFCCWFFQLDGELKAKSGPGAASAAL